MRQYYRWDQELEPTDVDQITLDIALWCANAIQDDLIREEVSALLLGGDLLGLLRMEVAYGELSLNDALWLRQVISLFSKRSDIDLGVDREEVARAKFVASEEACSMTNECFRARSLGRFQYPPRVERVLWHAQRKIASILPEPPKLSDLRFRFGPGATTQISKREASARAKLGAMPSCSSELFPCALAVLREMPGWWDYLFQEGPTPRAAPIPIQVGKLAFVPKSAKEDRTIIVEPTLNTMCQAALGDLLGTYLQRAGIDIRDQSRNRGLARKGSLNGDLATVDLSSASDTISKELVFDLLGLEWGSFLSRFRTGTVDCDGVEMRLEKFSSMGNGFTFPLETLIFYALAYGCALEEGCGTRDVSAYGDDIIVPTAAYSLLLDVFRSVGFSVNREKSFSEGPFRESCGGDFYQGTDIRPFYLKSKDGPLRTLHLFQMHNFFYRKGEEDVCAYLLEYLHPSIRLRGPDGYGDGHLLGQWVPSKISDSHQRRGFCGTLFDTFTWRAARSFRAYGSDHVLPVYTTYLSSDEPSSNSIRVGAMSNVPRSVSRVHGALLLDGLVLPDLRVYHAKGVDEFAVSVPGVSGVNRISIYTFERQ